MAVGDVVVWTLSCNDPNENDWDELDVFERNPKLMTLALIGAIYRTIFAL